MISRKKRIGAAPKTRKKVTRKIKKGTRRKKAKPKTKGSSDHLRNSKTDNFLEGIRKDNSMIEYFTRLRILNPAARLAKDLNEPRREGGFVRLAHAREEFTAPIITKGKSVMKKGETVVEKERDMRNPFGEAVLRMSDSSVGKRR